MAQQSMSRSSSQQPPTPPADRGNAASPHKAAQSAGTSEAAAQQHGNDLQPGSADTAQPGSAHGAQSESSSPRVQQSMSGSSALPEQSKTRDGYTIPARVCSIEGQALTDIKQACGHRCAQRLACVRGPVHPSGQCTAHHNTTKKQSWHICTACAVL